MNLFLRTMFKLRQGPVQFFGDFLGHWARRILLETTKILEPFSFFWAGNFTHSSTAWTSDLEPYCGLPLHCLDIRTTLALISEAPTGWYERRFTLSRVFWPSVIADHRTKRTRGSNGRYLALYYHTFRWEEIGTWTGSPAFQLCRTLSSGELRTHISFPGGFLSEHPCWLPAVPDASDAFRRDSTMPAHSSCPCCWLQDLSRALEQEEANAHHGIPSLRFPWTPLP